MTQLTHSQATMFTYKPQPRVDTRAMPLVDPAQLSSTTLMRTLYRALSVRRGADSIGEGQFVAWLVNRLPVSLIDGAGNLHCDLRTSPAHRTMFTAHTDTVHRSEGANPIHLDGRLWRASEGLALGADDGAGVALLCHMIEAGVPGYYVFFRGEESGGVGSRWLAENMPQLFGDIDRAVAFDRGHSSDIITHQSCGRCCSDEFANALAQWLSTDTAWFMPDDSGVYTDTAEFVDLIAECTNVSVGYDHQHGDREELDVVFLQELAERVVQVLWDTLPVKRDPTPAPRSYARLGAYVEYDDEFANPLDTEEHEVSEAIEEARFGSYGWLCDLIAESVAPNDVGTAIKCLERSRLTNDVLNMADDMLASGFSADEVLADLFTEGTAT